jgi:hypothetical protein
MPQELPPQAAPAKTAAEPIMGAFRRHTRRRHGSGFWRPVLSSCNHCGLVPALMLGQILHDFGSGLALVRPTAVLLAIALWAAPALAASAIAKQLAAQSNAAKSAVEPTAPSSAVEHGASPPVAGQLGPREPATTAGSANSDTINNPRSEGLVDRLVAASWRINDLLKAGSAKLPALVLVLSAMLILPIAALASWAVRGTARIGGLHGAGPRKGSDATASQHAHGVADAQAWPARAWLAVEGDAAGAQPIAGEMLRIGRHPDNEVWLTEDSVHRYHAVIHRTEDGEFIITDLSGEAGNGVHVNGARLAKARLTNGDVIQLGRAKLTFASTPL